MASLADYFAKERHVPKYEFAARVFGKWHNIPFIGTVYNDTVISEDIGPVYHLSLDLPLKYKDKYYTHLFVKHKEVSLKRLETIEMEELNGRKRSSRKNLRV